MSEQIWIGFMIGWVITGLFCCLMFWLMTRPLCKKWNAMIKYIDNIEFRFIKVWNVWINENSNFYSANYIKLDKLKDRLMNFNNLKIEGEEMKKNNAPQTLNTEDGRELTNSASGTVQSAPAEKYSTKDAINDLNSDNYKSIGKALSLNGQQQYDYILEMLKETKSRHYKRGYLDCLQRIKDIVNSWYDTSIKDPNSKIALMITNGGYISKFDLLKKLEEVEMTFAQRIHDLEEEIKECDKFIAQVMQDISDNAKNNYDACTHSNLIDKNEDLNVAKKIREAQLTTMKEAQEMVEKAIDNRPIKIHAKDENDKIIVIQAIKIDREELKTSLGLHPEKGVSNEI